MKGEAVGNIDIFGVITAEAKVGSSVGSVGASAGGSAYWDMTDYSANVRLSGSL
jgi:hypothetical protein